MESVNVDKADSTKLEQEPILKSSRVRPRRYAVLQNVFKPDRIDEFISNQEIEIKRALKKFEKDGTNKRRARLDRARNVLIGLNGLKQAYIEDGFINN